MGRDVFSGGSFASGQNACLGSTPTPSGIDAFVKGAGPLTRGSGSQLGALGLGPINQFGSAIDRPAPPIGVLPTALDGLTFANSGSPKGNLGLTSHCIPDYYSTMPTSANTSGPIDTSISGAYSRNGPLSLGSLVVGDGAHVAIYVNGDVNINGNIVFANSTGWASTDHVPSFYLIATGNINIASGVSQLDGVYVAQPNAAGNNGLINTCSNGGSLFAPNFAYLN